MKPCVIMDDKFLVQLMEKEGKRTKDEKTMEELKRKRVYKWVQKENEEGEVLGKS